MDRFENWQNWEIGKYIFERCTNEQIKDFCGLSDEEYLEGINSSNNDFLFNSVLSTIEQIPEEEFNKFIDSIEQ
jgi:hypothetical protein